MNCAETQRLIHAYIDAELDMETVVEIERHLSECAECARLREQHDQLRQSFEKNKESLHRRPPVGLERRVRAELRKADRRSDSKLFSNVWRVGGVGIAVAMLAVVMWSVLPLLQEFPRGDRLANDVIASHVRSLMVDHMFDIASSDEHTVKPWFNGKLDFSPPVRDFATQGFLLVGGRLDYLSKRSVAAMVYRHQQHYINLYIWPADGASDSVVDEASSQGYYAFHWTQAGMNYWVISELNSNKLQEFVRLLRTFNE